MSRSGLALPLDVKFALRSARRRPGPALTIALTAALGVGAVSATFSVLDAVLWSALPFPHPERIVRFATQRPQPDVLRSESFASLQAWRTQLPVFSAVAGYWEGGVTRVVNRPTGPERVPVAVVTEDFATVLGVSPTLGRTFNAGDHVIGAAPVAMLAYEEWQTDFGGSPTAVGRSIRVADTLRTIVGVLPHTAFEFPPGDNTLWIPAIPQGGFASDRNHWLTVIGRLRPGVSIERALAEARTVTRRSSAAPDGTDFLSLTPLRDDVVQTVRPALWLLGSAVLCFLLIACVNIAAALFAQLHERTRELAVRAAIGGSRGRVLRQLAVECLLVVGIGGAAGAAGAPLARGALFAAYPGAFPRVAEVVADWRMLLIAAGSIVFAVLVALAPMAWSTRRQDLFMMLRGHRGGVTREHRRLASVLAVGQVAFSLVLVFAAALLLKTAWRLSRIDPGFDANGIVGFSLTLPATRSTTDEQIATKLDDVLRRLRATPGVQSAEAVNYLPMPGRVVGYGTRFSRVESGDSARFKAQLRVVTPGYLRELHVQLVHGRWTEATDGPTEPLVVLVNRALARSAFPNERPLGKRIVVEGKQLEIVGVIEDFHHWGLWQNPEPELYIPYRQFSWSTLTIAMRVSGDLSTLAPAVRAELAAVDPGIPRPTFSRLADKVGAITAPDRFRALLATTLGALALVLSAIGIYGVVASGVAAQTREIGIRMALGQDARSVRREVIKRGLLLTAVGIAIGAVGGTAAATALSSFVHGVPASDPSVLAGVAATFLGVVLAATYVPARRASRISPLEAMRE